MHPVDARSILIVLWAHHSLQRVKIVIVVMINRTVEPERLVRHRDRVDAVQQVHDANSTDGILY